MTLTCRETRGRFESYAAETLAAEERRGVREHLGACDACRDYTHSIANIVVKNA